ncbi:orotidine 5'-phosphate decarboxylase [Candidatus Pacearchaeota archaeon]|nr:orotidine 5'-phosphate decarboxylase [Candidatus Pacearchaeota archaeon]
MTQTFREKWLEVVERKNSVLCAGLDPAEFEMGRENEGLAQDITKEVWAFNYIKAVAPYCAAVKPNVQYWKNDHDMLDLQSLTAHAHNHDLLVIDDSKLADIGSSNDAGMYHTQHKKIDAVTLACFAGNMQEAAEQVKKRNLGGIHMCLMSNPEYAQKKNNLVQISSEHEQFYSNDIVLYHQAIAHVKQYIQLAFDAQRFGLESIVVGAPSKKNHITEEELKKVREYAGDKMLVLLPGVGAQEGEAGIIWKYFHKDHVIVNVGRDLMFPNGSVSTPGDQGKKAHYYRDMLNELRGSKAY